jgi:glycosyltransferase involved in cell wall biosynthesis
MKVLVIFPDSMSKPTGGLGVQFKNLYERLNNKIDFYIAGYPDYNNGIKNYVHVGHPVPDIKHGTINTLLGHTVYLAESLKFPKPDLVHAYDWTTYFAGVYLAQIHKVPLLVTMQLSANALVYAGVFNCDNINTVDGLWLHKAHIETEWFSLKKADKIISVSNGYSNYFPSLKDKTVVIPNGIDLKSWTPKQKIILPGKNKYKVVYIGRFALMKSVDTLLDIDVPDNIDLIFVGSKNGGDAICINKLQDALNNKKKNVYYYGPAYDQEKIDVLEAADAVIVPSRHEPFGIVALEALASKSILISSRKDGLGDFLNDNNSIKCDVSKEGIEKSLNDFLNLSQQQKNTFIENGLKVCKEYNWDDIAEQYYQIYKSFSK